MLQEIRDHYSYHRKWTDRFAEHDVRSVFEKAARDLATAGFGELQGKRVLDLGCGQRYAFALQSAAAGATVTALDINYVQPGALPIALWRMAKHNGPKRALKSGLRQLLFDDRYYSALEQFSGAPLRRYLSDLTFVTADPTAGNYPLPTDGFDLIVSINVLEHVVDISKFAAEVARMLVPGGYFYAIIHNFYSISGGHDFEWVYPDECPSTKVPPWDHLRANQHPSYTYLNRLRPGDYRSTFARYLAVLLFEGRGLHSEAGEVEGENLLTEDVALELAQYPRSLLLTRSWHMICRRE